jgi:hypothetical protein
MNPNNSEHICLFPHWFKANFLEWAARLLFEDLNRKGKLLNGGVCNHWQSIFRRSTDADAIVSHCAYGVYRDGRSGNATHKFNGLVFLQIAAKNLIAFNGVFYEHLCLVGC